jgi:hypothetical protein
LDPTVPLRRKSVLPQIQLETITEPTKHRSVDPIKIRIGNGRSNVGSSLEADEGSLLVPGQEYDESLKYGSDRGHTVIGRVL